MELYTVVITVEIRKNHHVIQTKQFRDYYSAKAWAENGSPYPHTVEIIKQVTTEEVIEKWTKK